MDLLVGQFSVSLNKTSFFHLDTRTSGLGSALYQSPGTLGYNVARPAVIVQIQGHRTKRDICAEFAKRKAQI